MFSFLFHFSMKFMSENRIAPDGAPRSAASHLGLFGLPMSYKKDARLIWVKQICDIALFIIPRVFLRLCNIMKSTAIINARFR